MVSFVRCRGSKPVDQQRCMSKLAGSNGGQAKTRRSVDYSSSMPKGENQNDDSTSSSYWMPDARTGIYVPKGHDWVMEDVPECAASFKQTYWLRNVDGVDKPQPDYYQFDI